MCPSGTCTNDVDSTLKTRMTTPTKRTRLVIIQFWNCCGSSAGETYSGRPVAVDFSGLPDYGSGMAALFAFPRVSPDHAVVAELFHHAGLQRGDDGRLDGAHVPALVAGHALV